MCDIIVGVGGKYPGGGMLLESSLAMSSVKSMEEKSCLTRLSLKRLPKSSMKHSIVNAAESREAPTRRSQYSCSRNGCGLLKVVGEGILCSVSNMNVPNTACMKG